MDVDTIMLADFASQSESQKLNVMGVFNRIMAKQFPARHPEMFIVTKISASNAEANTVRKLTIKILDEDATGEFLNYSRDIKVEARPGGMRFEMNGILKVADVVFPKAGTYQISVLVDGDEKATLPLYLVEGDAV